MECKADLDRPLRHREIILGPLNIWWVAKKHEAQDAARGVSGPVMLRQQRTSYHLGHVAKDATSRINGSMRKAGGHKIESATTNTPGGNNE